MFMLWRAAPIPTERGSTCLIPMRRGSGHVGADVPDGVVRTRGQRGVGAEVLPAGGPQQPGPVYRNAARGFPLWQRAARVLPAHVAHGTCRRNRRGAGPLSSRDALAFHADTGYG